MIVALGGVFGAYAVRDGETTVGEAVLARPRDGASELLVVIEAAHRGRGLGEEAAAELVDRALLAVERVVAHVPPGTPTGALGRLGFVAAGVVEDPDDGPLERWERARHGADGFVGAWRLDREACRFEGGSPPLESVYVVAPTAGGVAFTVDWVEADGARHVAFTAAFGETEGFSLLRDGDALVTRAPAGPVRLARRVLSPDRRTMTVEQDGERADGTPFRNVSVYRRATWAPRVERGVGG